MKDLKRLCLLVLPLLVLASCFKEDIPIVLPTPGSASVMQIPMGENYDHQVYFDLKTADTSGSNYYDWDLAFESGVNQFHVFINGGSQALVSNKGVVSFASVLDTTSCLWAIDPTSWNTDSLAFGNWCDDFPVATSHNEVFILDRGVRYSTNERYFKIQLLAVSNTSYSFKYQSLFGGGSENTFDLQKDSSRNYNYFTFNNGGQQVEPEPDKTQWDLQFTHYRFIYYQFNPPFPYAVSGVLINPINTFVAKDSITPFDSINYSKALTYNFQNTKDEIGFSWKAYNFTSASYTCKPYLVYIIHDQKGYYWKLHFIDFYNDLGIKGYPKFEWQQL